MGQGDSNAVPLPHTPIPARNRKSLLTDVNNFRHHADASVATLRLYSHRVGTVHSHRRNPHLKGELAFFTFDNAGQITYTFILGRDARGIDMLRAFGTPWPS